MDTGHKFSWVNFSQIPLDHEKHENYTPRKYIDKWLSYPISIAIVVTIAVPNSHNSIVELNSCTHTTISCPYFPSYVVNILHGLNEVNTYCSAFKLWFNIRATATAEASLSFSPRLWKRNNYLVNSSTAMKKCVTYNSEPITVKVMQCTRLQQMHYVTSTIIA